METFLESKDSLLVRLGSDAEKGLTSKQADVSRHRFGRNLLTPPKSESTLKRIWEAATEPIIALLFVAGIIALAVNIFRTVTGGAANYLEVAGIFTAIIFSIMVDVVIEGRSAKAFEALSKVNDNTMVRVMRNGEVTMVKVMDIVCGDILLLAAGDKVPADCRLLESTALEADESALTGESVPVEKRADFDIVDAKCPLADRINMLYSGTYLTSGHGKVLVTAVGDETELGKIAGALKGEKKKATPLQARLNRLGRNITIFGIVAATLCFAIQMISFYITGTLHAENVMESFVVSIVLIVAAAPEGLPTIVAVSLSVNVIKLARQNTLVKKMIASETIGCINVICSDKTGTLTENKMTVGGYYDHCWHAHPEELDNEWLIHNICLNTTADIDSEGRFIGNPSECAMLNFYEYSEGRQLSGKSYHDERADHHIFQTFPFSSELKHMTTVSDADGKVIAYVKGSPECVLAMCALSSKEREKAEKAMVEAEEKAMRVIAFAHKELTETADYSDETQHRLMESHMVFDGFTAISDPLRKEVYSAVQSCRRAGIALKILTGDNIVTAKAIAKELHLLDERDGLRPVCVEARDIAELSDEALLEILPRIAVIARSTPNIKMRVVRLLKEQGHVVAVTGDGINDAPALKNADVGIAMGISGTEVSKEASDIVLLDDSFATIVKAVEWGRNIYENFKRFISFQLTVNVAAVICVFASIIRGYETPFTALQMLWINIIMDGIPALTLGLEPNYEDIMGQPPIKRSDNIIDRKLFIRIGVTAVYVSFFVLGQYFMNYLHVPESQMLTVVFAMFILFHLFNAFNCRELHERSIFAHFTGNKLMLVVMAVTFVLQVVFTQYAGSFFHTVPLSVDIWIKLFILAVTVVILSEFVRFVIRKMKRSKN